MKIGSIPENLGERILLRMGVIPTPLLDTLQSLLLARAVMAATKVGAFEALSDGALTASETASRTGTSPKATEKLLNALVGAGYLRHRGGRYELAPVARKWVLKSSQRSLRDNILFRYLEWEFLESLEEFLRTGEPIHAHDDLEPERWSVYQRGMRSLASLSADEVAQRIPMGPMDDDPREMMDIGGSHGYYSVALCRRYPGLRSTVLDLPQAVEQAAGILAEENMGDRVQHRAGNALTEDFGVEAWDLVFISQLVHHFDDAANRALCGRIARALRPGGVLAMLEEIRPASPEKAGQTAALLDFYFALTSESGTWSLEEIIGWQESAGLQPLKPIWLRTVPGAAIQAARKA